MRKVEILAPAGSYESLKAAVYAGCDAVYIGGSRFGARAFANNLEEKDMLEAIDFVHLHGKKIYLTVNTLLKEEELKELYSYLKPYYEQGLDAVIVQDVGVLKYVHEHFPKLPIHASTQMTLTGGEGVKLLQNMGVTRLVPARELSLEEIKEIRQSTESAGYPIEIETFVHGALCYCYSGQCLLSSMIGGRSGNRGRCAQPCRMPYTLDGEKREASYLLSPKDICTVSLIPELIEAGIDSFKIEGRMKRPEYTAYTAYIYGKYTDLYLELGREGYRAYLAKHKEEYEKDMDNLMDLYNRGSFTTGYYSQYHGKEMMSFCRPNHNGVLAGEVIGVKKIEAQIKLSRDICGQDVLEFRDEKGENLYDYTVKDDCRKGTIIKARFKPGSRVAAGNLVYRTKNQKLLEEIGKRFLEGTARIPIEGRLEAVLGQPVRLTLTDKMRQITVEAVGECAEEAKNQPMTREKLLSSINQISNTEYVFDELDAVVEGKVFVPVGKLKELRREALGKLEEAVLSGYRRETVDLEPDREKERERETGKQEANRLETGELKKELPEANFFVTVWSEGQAEAACQMEEVKRIAILAEQLIDERMASKAPMERMRRITELIRGAGKECYISLPYIDRFKKCDTFLDQFSGKVDGYKEDSWSFADSIDGFLVRSMEQIAILGKKYPDKKLILDSNLYTLNSEAKNFWKQKGIDEYTTSVELNSGEIRRCENGASSLIVYGHLPLMVSAQCLLDNCKRCQKEKGYTGFHTLRDRMGKDYWIVNRCENCYNIIYDSQAVSLLQEGDTIRKMGHKFLRFDFTVETKEETWQILKAGRDSFCLNKKTVELPDTTKGHFFRGIE